MAKRRANGEGTIGFSEAKGLWYCCLTIGAKADGKPKRIYKYGQTQSEVLETLNSMKYKYGTLKLSSDISLEDWFPEWLFEYKSDLSPGTIQDYLNVLNKHIKPYSIAKMNLADITGFELKKYFNQLVRDGRSKQRLQVIRNRLMTFFNESLEYVPRNPLIGVSIPKNAPDKSRTYTSDKIPSLRKEIRAEGSYNAFTTDEQKKLLTHLYIDSTATFNLMFIMFLGTGLRLGELLALHWDRDFNDDYTEVYIHHNLQREPIFKNREVVGYQKIETIPKSEASNRSVPLPLILTKNLKKAHAMYKLRVRTDKFFEDNDLVFHDDFGEYIDEKKPLRRLRKLEEELELSLINVHGLRHSYATRLFEVGEEIEIVSSLLGHSTVDITRDIYVHILDERKKKVALKINDILVI